MQKTFVSARGCPRLLRLILLAGGDPLQATEPSGRRPIDLAREVNREGSHDEVLELLSSEASPVLGVLVCFC